MRDLNAYSMLLLDYIDGVDDDLASARLLPMKRPQLKLKVADIDAKQGEKAYEYATFVNR